MQIICLALLVDKNQILIVHCHHAARNLAFSPAKTSFWGEQNQVEKEIMISKWGERKSMCMKWMLCTKKKLNM